MCRLILPFHALTGCDSTSCFKWKGKKKGLEILQKDESLTQLEGLGNTADFPETLIDVCILFVCQLYQASGRDRDIDKVRYKVSRCATAQCVCKRVSLSCTSVCLCEADDEVCENCRREDEVDSDDEDSDSDEMEDE